MREIKVLDCTLRDGGYCNEWDFGEKNIKKIIRGLAEAGLDIIECGFLSNLKVFTKDSSRFNSLDQISEYIPAEFKEKSFVTMINFGEYNINDIPVYKDGKVDGIRLAFHKKDRKEALKQCELLSEKKYKVFVQPMVTLNYTDEEFLDLIRDFNKINPYAFYIVDSFGVMKKKELLNLYKIVEENLNKKTKIGYHSHNNMQLSFSNAQELVELDSEHGLIIDSSVYGMGRGAGNLNTELFMEYLNDNIGKKYNIKPLLNIIDEVLNFFYQKNYWGYSLPNYLSAKHNVHPNYAGYLVDKQTLTVDNIDDILNKLDTDKKVSFNKDYIENLYMSYQEAGKLYDENIERFKMVLEGKSVLIIAPGNSAEYEKENILEYAGNKNIVTISVNFDYKYFDTDYIFLSNLRRYRQLPEEKRAKTIVTSNIPAEDVFLKTKYSNLINNIESVKDNAALMLIKLLINLDVSEVLIAGVDGYSHDYEKNFSDRELEFISKNSLLDEMNQGISKVLKSFSEKINIKYVTKEHYIHL